ncbi:MAG: Ni/Fe hydrogenase subunit alpha [Anaerolineales bacterium]
MIHNIEVPALARVEGEGALYIRLKDGSVSEIELNIYEPPRFFEGFLRGRHFQQVPDITARICGICPVAYQMSSVQALEKAMQVQVTPEIRSLRRLFYDAEYIESHALHIYMLQAPDLLGYESALSLAEVAPQVVKRALRLKKIGNQLMRIIGGRSVHPVNTCVGGFYSWPKADEIQALIPDLQWGLEASLETVRWAATLEYPDLEIEDYEFVATRHTDEYGILEGSVASSSGAEMPVEAFENAYLETHVRWSNALHSQTASGSPYITGPLARLNLNYSQLGEEAQGILEEAGLELPITNPYKALMARAIELVEVYAEALRLSKAYQPQGPSSVAVQPRAGEGSTASEAPRGLLYHRYVVDEQGKIRYAKIVPPTAQNLARIEADLWKLAPQIIELPQEQATRMSEHLVRSYDPCISCATHFLTLKIENSAG